MRPSPHDVLMGCAQLWASRSTCSRLHVGAVFARDQRILVTGYNGAPSGIEHCNHDCNCELRVLGRGPVDRIGHFPDCPAISPCLISEHAERNAIAFAARHGIKLEGSTLYVTHMPCLACSMAVINAGVEKVFYDQTYRDDSGVRLLRKAGIGALYLAPQATPGIG